MRAIGKLGEIVWVQWDELRHAAAVIGTVLSLCVQPRYWARPVRNLFAQQLLAVGVEPVGFVCAVAAFVGVSVVVQLAFWTGKAGQSQLLGPLLVAVVARELGPLLTNIVVIVRSSSAMATELVTSASCCIGGLGVGGSVTDIPHATQRALTRSIAGLFVISAVVSLLTYL